MPRMRELPAVHPFPRLGPGDHQRWVVPLHSVGLDDVPLVGGKSAGLGELLRALGEHGVPVPEGFAVTTAGYRHFIDDNDLVGPLEVALAPFLSIRTSGKHDEVLERLEQAASHAQSIVIAHPMPGDLQHEILEAHRELRTRLADDVGVAVRSSATAEDLPEASFAGAHATFLDIHGDDAVLDAVHRCFASLFTARAISYRSDLGFSTNDVALSVCVQRMVRTGVGRGAAGVAFTLDTETGFRDVVQLEAAWGSGESIVQGRVTPDEWFVHKPTLSRGFRPIIGRTIGDKEIKRTWDPRTGAHAEVPTTPEERTHACFADDEVLRLARWAVAVERHWSEHHGRPTPMDLEIARDGVDGTLWVVQARPETVHGHEAAPVLQVFTLDGAGTTLTTGLAVGERIASGPVRVVTDPSGLAQVKPGDVLVTTTTDPDWEPVLRIASAVVTERGGRTSHAAIVAREIGIPAVVGATGAMRALDGRPAVTVSCAEGTTGRVYDGVVPFRVEDVDPAHLPRTDTAVLVNIADPDLAFGVARLPVDGVGLARMEFVLAGSVRVHPLAITRPEALSPEQRADVEAVIGTAEPHEWFVDRLATGIGRLTAAFWPRPVVLRFSDFKTNEYAHLVGGAAFEPVEENPMLGWRGASRYHHPDYEDGFALEVEAVRRVREEMGLVNLELMIPFCRTPEEGRQVLKVMARHGLERGRDGLRVLVMAEIPSNVILADRFAELFDGFSIGSNDLTQLTLGVDRDSERIADLFDEGNEAVLRSFASLIDTAHRHGRRVGICGQAPSDDPEIAAFLVQCRIDSVSLSPDAVARTRRRIAQAESERRSNGSGAAAPSAPAAAAASPS